MTANKRDRQPGISFKDKIACTVFLGYMFLSSGALIIKNAIQDRWQKGKWFPNS